jgi:beta-glucosidase
MSKIRAFLLFVNVFVLSVVAALAQQSAETPPYKNPSLPVGQRVSDLVSRMTLEEGSRRSTQRMRCHLGIPEYNWWNEGLHGVGRAGYATVFPQAIGLAATPTSR